LASFGKAHSKSASAKVNENAKFRPCIAPKCVWLKRSPDPLAAIRGPTSKGREGKGEGRGREERGRGRREREGKGAYF